MTLREPGVGRIHLWYLEAWWRDVRLAARSLRNQGGFSAVALLTLAGCIGPNLAIFAVVNAILLRALPFPEPQRLVAVYNEYPHSDLARSHSSFANLYYRRGNLPAFSSLAAYKEDAVNVGDATSSQRADILRVSADFFETLGVAPAMGRGFTEEEMTYQAHHVAILSDAFWRARFQARPDVVGRSVRINGFSKTIVGVLPPGFRFLSSRAEILLPLSSPPEARGIQSLHNSAECDLIGRLRPEATLTQARTQIDAQNAILGREFPYAKQVEATGFRTVVAPLKADHVAAVRPALLLLQAGGLLLLAIAAVNLTNLLLVRMSGRTKELAIRQSLGANRSRLAHQLLTETCLLSGIGGVSGLAVGALILRGLSAFGVDRMPLGAPVSIDGRVLLGTLALALVLGIGVGLPILWLLLCRRPTEALHEGGRSHTAGRAVQRWRQGFVAAQVALAFVLLTGAGLLAVSLHRALAVSPGFRPDSLLAGHISLVHPSYFAPEARLRFAERVVEALSALPGVQAVGVANNLPLGGPASGDLRRVMTAADRPHGPHAADPIAPNLYGVAGDFFQALGIPLRAGRLFDGRDSQGNTPVCLVDESLARRFWGDLNPLGRWVCDGPEVESGRTRYQVIGLVGNVRQTELTEPSNDGTLYLPFRDNPVNADTLCVFLRTGQRADFMAGTVQRILRRLEPDLPLYGLRTMEARLSESLGPRRSPLWLAGGFAVGALLLASLGTYGVLSVAVTQRRREIGVRLALGALPGAIGWQFLMLGFRWFLAGAIPGLATAWFASRAMRGLLFGIPPFHLPTLTAVALVLGLVSVAAGLIPAWRASRVDPCEALRQE